MQLRAAFIAVAVFFGAVAGAQTPNQDAGSPANVKLASILVTLDGDSSLHKWSAKTRAVSLRGTMPSADPERALSGDGRREIEVVIPVATLRSESSGLDKNMYAALRKDEFPEITFELATWRAAPNGEGAYRVAANGTLSIAGRAREVTIHLDAKVRDGGIQLEGAVPLKMTDFGVKPPSFLGGAMKASDDVKVTFNAVVKMVPAVVGTR